MRCLRFGRRIPLQTALFGLPTSAIIKVLQSVLMRNLGDRNPSKLKTVAYVQRTVSLNLPDVMPPVTLATTKLNRCSNFSIMLRMNNCPCVQLAVRGPYVSRHTIFGTLAG